MSRDRSGFTLLETMFAMVILAIALMGAFAAFVYVSRELREAQLRQYKTVLAQAKIERLRLANRSSFFPAPNPNPGVQQVELLAPAQGGWTMDTSNPSLGDLGTGGLFRISPNGNILRENQSGITGCDQTSIPDGAFCREVLIHADVPGTALNGPLRLSLPGIRTSAVTVWVRVLRKGEPVGAAAVQAQVLVQ